MCDVCPRNITWGVKYPWKNGYETKLIKLKTFSGLLFHNNIKGKTSEPLTLRPERVPLRLSFIISVLMCDLPYK